jgi:hypothetical protein
VKSGVRVVLAILALMATAAGGYLVAKSTSTSTTTTTSSSSTTSTTTTSTTLATATCSASQFHGTLAAGSGAAGTIFTSVSLINEGPTCTMNGFGTLVLHDGSGAVINVTFNQSSTYFNGALGSPTSFGAITVAHLSSASMALAFSDHPGTGQSFCPAVSRFTVALPGDTSGSAVSVQGNGLFAPCSSAPVTYSPLYLTPA